MGFSEFYRNVAAVHWLTLNRQSRLIACADATTRAVRVPGTEKPSTLAEGKVNRKAAN